MDQDQANRGVTLEGRGEWDEELGELVLQSKEKIEDYVRSKPHAALGIAAALGFVLGGGLTPRRLMRLGFAAGGPLLSRQLASEAFKLVMDTLEQDSEPKKAKRRSKRPAAEAE
jgi:hypothetical protein